MSLTVVGTALGALGPVNTVSHPTRGASFEAIYSGTEEYIQAVYLSTSSDFIREIDRSAAPKIFLRVRSGDDGVSPNDAVYTYELLGNTLHKDLREHPNIKSLGAVYIAQVSALTNIKPETEADRIALQTKVDALNPIQKIFYDLLSKGTNSYAVTQFNFRVTKTISFRNQIPIAFSNIERVYTTDQLTAEVNPPSTIFFSITEAAAAVAPASPDANYTFGWLKQPPIVQQATSMKWQIVQEYWLEEWANLIYAAAS